MPKTTFMKVKCECGNEETVYSNAVTEVKCKKCQAVLASPRGGRANVKSKAVTHLK